MVSARDAILGRVRNALGRQPGQPPGPVPPVRLDRPKVDVETLVLQFCRAVDALGAKSYTASDVSDARSYIARLIEGKQAIASNSPVLADVGITQLPGVRSGVLDKGELRSLCAQADVGVTGADYALGDTGSLVMLSSREEARMISLLPPVHVAVVSRGRILSGLDELLSRVPLPADITSSMVFITGTSRTADIEQILVRGVHGPGEVHVVVV